MYWCVSSQKEIQVNANSNTLPNISERCWPLISKQKTPVSRSYTPTGTVASSVAAPAVAWLNGSGKRTTKGFNFVCSERETPTSIFLLPPYGSCHLSLMHAVAKPFILGDVSWCKGPLFNLPLPAWVFFLVLQIQVQIAVPISYEMGHLYQLFLYQSWGCQTPQTPS